MLIYDTINMNRGVSMLDKKGIAVLIALNKVLKAPGFKIIELSDVSNCLEAVELTAAEIKTILLDLVAKQYILKKYIDNEEYCISITDMAIVKVKELELIELEKLTASAVLKRNSAGETVIAVGKAGESAVVKEDEPVVEIEPQHVEAEIVTKRKRKRTRRNNPSIDNSIVTTSNANQIAVKPSRIVAAGLLGGVIGGVTSSGIMALVYYIITVFSA